MNMQSELKSQLKGKYQELFRKYGVDEQTGQLGYDPTRKFATYPYIGSRYGNGEAAKILIVGLDIGEDETPERPGRPGWFQSFEERRAKIEDKELRNHNPHIAGTYFTALFFLKEDLGWDGYWEELKQTKIWIKGALKPATCKEILNTKVESAIPKPLSHIALTNYYKFVTIGRTKRTGGDDRKHLLGHFDREFFIEEVETFNPEIVVFQGAEFEGNPVPRRLMKTGRSVYVGPHPTYREKGGRAPEHFVKRILDSKL